jgi:hypothetical protein
MQSSTASEVVNKPEKAKESLKVEVVKAKTVNEVKPKEQFTKEVKCSIICGDVNYII